jgi:hypothetical protein
MCIVVVPDMKRQSTDSPDCQVSNLFKFSKKPFSYRIIQTIRKEVKTFKLTSVSTISMAKTAGSGR